MQIARVFIIEVIRNRSAVAVHLDTVDNPIAAFIHLERAVISFKRLDGQLGFTGESIAWIADKLAEYLAITIDRTRRQAFKLGNAILLRYIRPFGPLLVKLRQILVYIVGQIAVFLAYHRDRLPPVADSVVYQVIQDTNNQVMVFIQVARQIAQLVLCDIHDRVAAVDTAAPWS